MNLSHLVTGEVYTFKFNSGEELIAKVKFAGNDHIIIDEPVSVAPGPQGMGLIPSLFTGNPTSETRINTSSVAIVALTDDKVKTKYIEATTGLTVPDKKILVG